jgi:hypothetical protein
MSTDWAKVTVWAVLLGACVAFWSSVVWLVIR